MEDSARLKLIILGLVLAAIAGAYLFFSGRFAAKNNVAKNVQPTASPIAIAQGQNQGEPIVIPGNTPVHSDVPGPVGPQGQPLPQTGMPGNQPPAPVQSLPNTGLPMDLMGTLGAGAIVIGYTLRRFPK